MGSHTGLQLCSPLGIFPPANIRITPQSMHDLGSAHTQEWFGHLYLERSRYCFFSVLSTRDSLEKLRVVLTITRDDSQSLKLECRIVRIILQRGDVSKFSMWAGRRVLLSILVVVMM